MVFSISNLLIQSAINSLGTDAMAGATASFNIEIMAYFISNAFGQAAVTFVGQNHGAANYQRCKEIVKQTQILNWISMIVFGIVMIVFGREVLGIFNDDMAVIRLGYERLVILMVAEVLNSTIETLSGGHERLRILYESGNSNAYRCMWRKNCMGLYILQIISDMV